MLDPGWDYEDKTVGIDCTNVTHVECTNWGKVSQGNCTIVHMFNIMLIYFIAGV